MGQDRLAHAMRVSRLVILGLSGSIALHIFMLAGHGHGPDPFAGMHTEMTIICLAVVAGLLLLQPQQRRQMIPNRTNERGPTWDPARSTPGRLRRRSLEELCISLT